MSREVEFRGKDKYGNWIYGDLLQYSSGETAILNRFSRYGYEVTEICNRSKVLPETIGQYIGLKDKYGEKIYEGDLVKVHKGKYVVEYWTGQLLVSWFLKSTTSGDTEYMEMACIGECEVIGNIHDNLLNKNKKPDFTNHTGDDYER